MTNDFGLLGLRPELMQTIVERGYSAPTPIQSELIPAMLAGRDVIGQSQTGSGKTAAYGLPILQGLVAGQSHVQSLVIVPTRELAIQVAEAMEQYGRRIGVRALAIYGGQPYRTQINRIQRGVDVVVGTPGRMLDLLRRRSMNLEKVTSVVLDEADEMLSMGFVEDIQAILEATPAERQTAMFSATMPESILRLSKRHLRDPHTFTMGHRILTVATVEQRYYLINETDRLASLTRLFEVEPITSALVFARTRLGTSELAHDLTDRGFQAEVLNGDLDQEARERVLQRFRSNQVKVLVATDVAARGLDIDHVTHVFNYELPSDPEGYVHRIGRTGRAGKSGVAVSLVTPKERWFLRKIEAYTKQKMTPTTLPSEAYIHTRREERLIEQVMVWLRRGRTRRERDLVRGLAEQGHDLIEIAAAALKAMRSEEKQRPIAPISEVCMERVGRPKPKNKRPPAKRPGGGKDQAPVRASREEGMVRLAIGSGRADGLKVGHVVGSLAHHIEIPGNCLGKIRIEDRTTYVDVPKAMVGLIMAKRSTFCIGRRRIDIRHA